MANVTVRYIVDDVDAAIDFCQAPRLPGGHAPGTDLRHAVAWRPPPRAQRACGQAMPNGTLPAPGGWNRFSLEVPDLARAVDDLRQAGVHFRNDIVEGVGGKQILIDDRSGNPVELFVPAPR
jgi:catechol 2,3-dioxygenase-like lactoylglutathione lyase family enzyme